MKILHVIPSVGPVRGGPSKAILEMVSSLRALDIEAEVVATNDNGPDLLDVPLGQKTIYQDIPIQFFPRFSPAIAPIREFAFSSSLTVWLWQHIQDYDLIHIHAIFSYPSTIAMTIARQREVPYIVRPIGQLCEWSLQQSARKKQIYLSLIERSNLNHSRAIHVTSQQEQQDVSQLNLTAQSFILPLGLNLPTTIVDARQQLRQRFKLPPDEPVILFLSRLHPKKGIEYLIESLTGLTHHRFTLIIAGSGDPDYEGHLRSVLLSHRLHTRTHLTNFVVGEAKQLLLQGADLFALTSHSENFGIAVLEALAAGLPAIVTPGVALATLVKQHDLGYVTELNPAAIASAIDSFLCDISQAKAMGDRARQITAEQYTWQSISLQLKQIYRVLLNEL
jgi:glycosyltransferase involved in cell wall biosynthesis